MSNSYFQFKQFRIEQDACAMKVSTDACILGAWTPVFDNVKRVLDIGTGTGLLSLMIAQRADSVIIDAIEIDNATATQAQENVSSSPWKERINIIKGDVRTYSFGSKYDFIICNPPFFNNSLLGNDDSRNMVRHTLSLSYEQLLHSIQNLLTSDGYACILLPAEESAIWERLAMQAGMYVFCQLHIKHTADAPVKRIISLLSKNNKYKQYNDHLVIKNGAHYTTEFIELLHPYYASL